MEPKFAGYALDSPAAQTQKSLMGRGITIMHIYSGQLKHLWFLLPPLAEQAAIFRFLDHANDLIDRYISVKERLITLLEEQRQACHPPRCYARAGHQCGSQAIQRSRARRRA